MAFKKVGGFHFRERTNERTNVPPLDEPAAVPPCDRRPTVMVVRENFEGDLEAARRGVPKALGALWEFIEGLEASGGSCRQAVLSMDRPTGKQTNRNRG